MRQQVIYIRLVLFLSLAIVFALPQRIGAQEGKFYLGGDANDDGNVNLTDALHLLQFLFSGGKAPACPWAVDVNGDKRIDITDPVNLLEYLFLGEDPPVFPLTPARVCGLLDWQDPANVPVVPGGPVIINPNDPHAQDGIPPNYDDTWAIECPKREKIQGYYSIIADNPQCPIPILSVYATPEGSPSHLYKYLGCADAPAVIYYRKRVDCEDATGPLEVFPSNNISEGSDFIDINTGSGDDVIVGPSSPVLDNSFSVSAGEGNDIIYGKNFGSSPVNPLMGGDLINGGEGNDIILGGADSDRIRGGLGSDLIFGGKGSDILIGEFLAGVFEDPVDSAGEGVDILFGEEGDDSLYQFGEEFPGVGTRIVMDGGEGNDRLAKWSFFSEATNASSKAYQGTGGAFSFIASGGPGEDRIYGTPGHDIIWGGTGKDILQGGLGRDTLFGGPGVDTIKGYYSGEFYYPSEKLLPDLKNDEGDFISGDFDPGIDLVMVTRLAGGHVAQVDGKPRYQGIDGEAVFSAVIQQIKETSVYSALQKGNAPDEIGGDKDEITGYCGNDIILGDGGNDWITGGNLMAPEDKEECASDNDHILGGAGDDIIIGDPGHDVVYGGSGNDILYGDRDARNSFALNDHTWEDYICGGAGKDRIFGDTPYLSEGSPDFLVSGPREGNTLQDREMVCDGAYPATSDFNAVMVCNYTLGYGFKDEDNYIMNGHQFNPRDMSVVPPPDINDYDGRHQPPWREGVREKYCRDNWGDDVDDEGEKCMMADSYTWGPGGAGNLFEAGIAMVLPFGYADTPDGYKDSPGTGGLIFPDCGLYGPSGSQRTDGGFAECQIERKEVCCICVNNCIPGWLPHCMPEGGDCGRIGRDEAETGEIPALWIVGDMLECNKPIYKK